MRASIGTRAVVGPGRAGGMPVDGGPVVALPLVRGRAVEKPGV